MIAPLHPSAARHVRRETIVSATINAILSIVFFALVFGFVGPVPVWGIGAYVFDFLPQSFAIGLMATLVPGLLTRKAILAGRLADSAEPPRTGRIVLVAVRNAALSAIVGTVIAAAILFAADAQAIDNLPALVAKTVYGALLGAFVTRALLRRMTCPLGI